MRRPKSRLRYAVDHGDDKVRQHQAAERWVHPQCCRCSPIAINQDEGYQADADQTQIQVSLYIAVVSLVEILRVPPAHKASPNFLCVGSDPKTLVAVTDQ